MSERRMFAKTIIDSDAFLDMPHSTQLLYFHLSMRADDEGFINNPKSIMRNVGCKDDDIKLLIAKKFIIPFDSGIVVIKHWRIHNYIQKDRFVETKYKEERATLALDENKAYTTSKTPCIQNVSITDTQYSIGKDSIGKDSIEKDKTKEEKKIFNEFSNGDDKLLETLNEFEKMRKLIKKPMTDRAKTMLLNKLRTFPKEQWIAILEQSIEHDWQTIYKLQTDDSSNTTKQTLPKNENDLVEYPPRSGNMIAKSKALELREEINRKIQKATSDEIEDLVVSPWTGDNITRIEYEIQRKAFDER